MAATKINLTKLVRTISANTVRGRSYVNFFYTKIYHTKVSLHKNFQIYGTWLNHYLIVGRYCS